MSDNLLSPTREIIRCCEALLSEADGALDEKQRQHIKGIYELAGNQHQPDRYPNSLLSGFNWYAAQTDSVEKERPAGQELGYFVRTPLAAIRTKTYVLLRSGDELGNLNEKQRGLMEQIQRCADQIQDELNRIWAEAR